MNTDRSDARSTAAESSAWRRLDKNARGVTFTVLGGAIGLMSAAALGAAVARPLQALRESGGSVPVELSESGQAQALAGIAGLPSGVRLSFASQDFPFELHVDSLSWPVRLLTQAGSSLLLASLGVAGILLLLTLRTIHRGEPFDSRNATRLRVVGILLIVGGMGGALLDAFARMALLDTARITDGPVQFSATISLAWAVGGLVSLALGEAFARGRILTDDVAGLI